KITSISDFAEAVKTASKGIAAFDQLDESQGENTLFGYGDGQGAHFDSMLAKVLEELGSDYASDFAEDLTTVDSVGHTVDYRLNMYSPLYYLLSSSEGYQTSNVAGYFRINTGIWQSDTAVNTEANLVLALQNYGSDVDYSFVWGQEHTMAERSGDSTSNFIEWVNECVAAESE
nr:tannase [Butyrivibrio sp.]